MRLGPNTRSRHLSLNHPGSKNKARAAKETSAETLRRKTSEATTVLSTTLTEHSWIAPPPPRPSKPKFKPTGLDEPGFDFSFDPPAESTIAHVRRPVRTPPQSAAGTAQDPLLALGSDDTPIARRPTLQDELAAASRPRKNKERHWKRHDSILSTDSEDPGTSISIFGLTPKPRPMNALPEDPDATPRNQPSLIQQFCEPRPRSGSVTVRALSNDIRSSAPPSLSSGDADDEMADSPLVRQDSSVRALAEACADIDLDGDSSPSRLIKAASRQTKGQRKIEVNKPSPPLASSPTVQRTRLSEKPYQLTPRTVHRLSQRRRVGMRIEDRPLSPNDDVDMFASYEFDRGTVMDTDN
ncbi:hypothetical protein FRC07_003448 [Ceratobasidium sp. 392]|nr:hypothetical protein FRC07_003448 [Ceratobasidium sp. 392]